LRARSALVVLCERPSNTAIDRSAQRRRRWVYAREGVLLAGWKSLSELATAP
jgi:hypothetical protein